MIFFSNFWGWLYLSSLQCSVTGSDLAGNCGLGYLQFSTLLMFMVVKGRTVQQILSVPCPEPQASSS